jgi:hypoxanthine-guanine phosphoribosyltransferase
MSILRAELKAILKAVQDDFEDSTLTLQIFTGCLLFLRLLRTWVHCPTTLEHLHLLDSIGQAVANR